MIGLKAGTGVKAVTPQNLIVARAIKGEEGNGEEKTKRRGGVILKTVLRMEEVEVELRRARRRCLKSLKTLNPLKPLKTMT